MPLSFVTDFITLGHEFSGLFDPDKHKKCDGVLTSGAEAINKQWRTSREHIRFFSAIHLWQDDVSQNPSPPAPFVEEMDVENKDVLVFANKFVPCTCLRCRLSQKETEEQHTAAVAQKSTDET